VADFKSSRAGRLLENVRIAFLSFLQQITVSNPAEACSLAKLTVDFAREAYKHASSVLPPDFIPSVQRARANALREANRVEEASSVLDVVVSAYCEICMNTPDSYAELFTLASRDLGDTLQALGRTQDLRDIIKERLIKYSVMSQADLPQATSELLHRALENVEHVMTSRNSAKLPLNDMKAFIKTYQTSGPMPPLLYSFAKSQWRVAEFLHSVGHEEAAFVAAQDSIYFTRILCMID